MKWKSIDGRKELDMDNNTFERVHKKLDAGDVEKALVHLGPARGKLGEVPPELRKARVGITEFVYHTPYKEGANGVGGPGRSPSYSRVIESREPPFTRPGATATDEWQPLEYGWLAGVELSILVIVNLDKTYDLHVKPHIDEMCTYPFVVRPGESMRVTPLTYSVGRVAVRCANMGCSIKYTTYMYPA